MKCGIEEKNGLKHGVLSTAIFLTIAAGIGWTIASGELRMRITCNLVLGYFADQLCKRITSF